MLYYNRYGWRINAISSYGAQDVYLTGNPQITFLKSFIRRTQIFLWNVFSKHLKALQIWFSRCCDISRNGGFNSCYIRFDSSRHAQILF